MPGLRNSTLFPELSGSLVAADQFHASFGKTVTAFGLFPSTDLYLATKKISVCVCFTSSGLTHTHTHCLHAFVK